jgi:hypothetical protein
MSHMLSPEIECQTLAFLTVSLMDRKTPWTTVAFKLALPQAYECLQATKELLHQKAEEKGAEAEKYWNSEEGKRRREEVKKRLGIKEYE